MTFDKMILATEVDTVPTDVPITADTITDDQIRRLRDVLEAQHTTSQRASDRMSCHHALYGRHTKHAARARCAQILNARRS